MVTYSFFFYVACHLAVDHKRYVSLLGPQDSDQNDNLVATNYESIVRFQQQDGVGIVLRPSCCTADYLRCTRDSDTEFVSSTVHLMDVAVIFNCCRHFSSLKSPEGCTPCPSLVRRAPDRHESYHYINGLPHGQTQPRLSLAASGDT